MPPGIRDNSCSSSVESCRPTLHRLNSLKVNYLHRSHIDIIHTSNNVIHTLDNVIHRQIKCYPNQRESQAGGRLVWVEHWWLLRCSAPPLWQCPWATPLIQMGFPQLLDLLLRPLSLAIQGLCLFFLELRHDALEYRVSQSSIIVVSRYNYYITIQLLYWTTTQHFGIIEFSPLRMNYKQFKSNLNQNCCILQSVEANQQTDILFFARTIYD